MWERDEAEAVKKREASRERAHLSVPQGSGCWVSRETRSGQEGAIRGKKG